jgi:hypothetical protein
VQSVRQFSRTRPIPEDALTLLHGWRLVDAALGFWIKKNAVQTKFFATFQSSQENNLADASFSVNFW